MAAKVLTNTQAGRGAHIPGSMGGTGRERVGRVARLDPASFPGSPGRCDHAHDAALLDDRINERAAIVEFDGGFSRREAQNIAARGHGFASWDDYQAKRERAET